MRSNPWVLSVIAGILFGIWPHYLNKAGLIGLNSPAAMSIVQGAILLALPLSQELWSGNRTRGIITLLSVITISLFSIWKWASVNTSWPHLIAASTMSAIGLYCLSHMMRSATDDTRGLFLATIFIMQVAVSMMISMYQNPKEITVTRIIGCTLAIISVILIHKKR